MNYKEILNSILNKELEPVYFLMGEESYYIDKISDRFSKSVLSDEEQAFNQITLYGKETSVGQVISESKQFPIGSEKRVVILKEAQHIKKIELLDGYINDPQRSTILVICYRGKSIDKRKKFGKNLKSKCVVFESKKIYENQIPDWISKYVNENGYTIEITATRIISDYLGTDLAKITNELGKLFLLIKKNEQITTKLIEHNIGISKDYNIFELQNALGKRDVLKANRIINYFASNEKNYHIVPIITSLFSYFQKIILYHFSDDKSAKSISNLLKINPYFVSQYKQSAKNYNKKQLFNIFTYLKEYDLKSKGVNNKSTSQSNLLKELIFKILHA